MTTPQRQRLAKLLDVPYQNRWFEKHSNCTLINVYSSGLFDYIEPVKIRNINAKLAIKLWKLL